MFTGRAHELGELEKLYRTNDFQMVVLYGRRRVGKTTLAFEFAKNKPLLSFTAKVQSDALNLADFSRSIYEYFGLPSSTGAFSSWHDAFAFIAKQAGDCHLVFIFDEFPYAAAKNESLVSTLQIVVDHLFSASNIFFILTGSNQGFMEEKVLGGAPLDRAHGPGEKNPLFGRRTAQIHLKPFDYLDAARMLSNTPPETLVKYYACVGGTPYYLSRVNESETFEENIERLFFTKEGILYEEPLMLLRQELREPALYSSILDAIAQGANKPQLIADKVGEDRTTVGKYIRTLSQLSLVSKTVPFGQNSRTSRKGIYELQEPCFSFWYRFVAPHADLIELDAGELAARETLREDILSIHVGYWFEKICSQWLIAQAKNAALPVAPLRFGRWWGSDPTTHEQEDIDVVADNPLNSEVLVGECKWRNSFNESEVIQKLMSRAKLLGEYRAVHYAIFSKRRVNGSTQEKLLAKGNWLLVDTNRLYADC